MADSERQKIRARWGALTTERSSWIEHWRDISQYLMPRNGRYFLTDRNKGEKRHNTIIDSTGTRANRILAAGMMAGMTSPARPWFRLTTSDPRLDEAAAVKAWLSDVTRAMQMIFSKSNTYRALHSQYEELGGFGTSASMILPDYKSVVHNYTMTAGEYAIDTDYRGFVNTLYREFEMTVGQIVEQFGLNNVSQTVRNLWNDNKLNAWVPVIHAVEPRKERDLRLRDALNMPFKSVYMESGGEGDRLLRESGFREFRGLCPRWMVAGGDVYGNSPGMEALGDIKQLQHQQMRKAQGIDYQTNPPLQVPTSMKEAGVDTLPGGVTYIDANGPQGGIRSAFEVNLNLSHLLVDIQDVRERIRSAFYADLFLMLANSTNPQMTATEVAERHEEKLLMIGPVLERMHNEILDPLISLTFSDMISAGVVPPPPPELENIELNVEYVSMLAQAQRAIGTNSVDRFVTSLGAVASIKPEVLDKLDADRWADAYGDMLGIDPELIVPGEQVALIRKQRAEAAQAQMQMQALQGAAGAAKDLSQTDTGGQNALTDVMGMFTGYTS